METGACSVLCGPSPPFLQTGHRIPLLLLFYRDHELIIIYFCHELIISLSADERGPRLGCSPSTS